MIVHASRPKGRLLPGWGDPGSEYAGVRFRTAILDTLQVIDTVLPAAAAAAPQHASTPIPTASRHASPLIKLLPLLEGEDPTIPKALIPLLDLYEKMLEDAKWSLDEPTKEDYETCLRITAVLVDAIGKRAAGSDKGKRDGG